MIYNVLPINFSFNLEDVLIYSLKNNIHSAVKVCLNAIRYGSLTLSHYCTIHLVVCALSSTLKHCTEVHNIFDSDKHLILSYSHILRYLRFLQSNCYVADGFQLYASAIMKLHKLILLHLLQSSSDAKSVKDYVHNHILPDFTNQSCILQKDVSLFNDFRKEVLKLQNSTSTLFNEEYIKSSFLNDEMKIVCNSEFWIGLQCDLKSYLEKILSYLPTSKLSECFESSCFLQQLFPTLPESNLKNVSREEVVLMVLKCMSNEEKDYSICSPAIKLNDNVSTDADEILPLYSNSVHLDGCENEKLKKANPLYGNKQMVAPDLPFNLKFCLKKNPVVVVTDIRKEMLKKASSLSGSKEMFSQDSFFKLKFFCTKKDLFVAQSDIKNEKFKRINIHPLDSSIDVKNKNTRKGSPRKLSTVDEKGTDRKILKRSLARKTEAETTPETAPKKPCPSTILKPGFKSFREAFKQQDDAADTSSLFFANKHRQLKDNARICLSDEVTSASQNQYDLTDLSDEPVFPHYSATRRKLFDSSDRQDKSLFACDNLIFDLDEDIVDESDCSDDESVILSLDVGHLPDFSKFLLDEPSSLSNPIVLLPKL